MQHHELSLKPHDLQTGVQVPTLFSSAIPQQIFWIRASYIAYNTSTQLYRYSVCKHSAAMRKSTFNPESNVATNTVFTT